MKLRTIITQDAEVDDQNSLRHFLLYANEVELQGIVQTSSVFHWAGKKGAVGPKRKINEFTKQEEEVSPYDQPYRWTGTDWMFREIDEYAQIYPNLIKHAEGYPTPEYLRTITKIGNVGYSGDMSGSTDGSELIRERILDDDPRTLYLQVWGGTNTICQALKDIEDEYHDKEGWTELREHISRKIVITACGEQDCTYRRYLAENWPDIKFVVVLQMRAYAYPWGTMPECDSKDSLKGKYMKDHILLEKNPLTRNYCTYLDGKHYVGELEECQYGTNPKTIFNVCRFVPEFPGYEKYDFISEGDSPTFFWMFNWGMRTEESFANGGFSGRYFYDITEKNSKGEQLNYWKVAKDDFTDRDGITKPEQSMWRYVRDIQHDMAARARWGITPEYKDGEHAPVISIKEGLDFAVSDKRILEFHAETASPDGGNVTVTWRIYKDASIGNAWKNAILIPAEDGLSAALVLPEDTESGDSIHVIACAEGDGPEKLRRYRQIIITL